MDPAGESTRWENTSPFSVQPSPRVPSLHHKSLTFLSIPVAAGPTTPCVVPCIPGLNKPESCSGLQPVNVGGWITALLLGGECFLLMMCGESGVYMDLTVACVVYLISTGCRMLVEQINRYVSAGCNAARRRGEAPIIQHLLQVRRICKRHFCLRTTLFTKR